MMHFGHANSLRQAKLMGDYLVVGVHTDGTWLRLGFGWTWTLTANVGLQRRFASTRAPR
jgi:bifunctional ADP-heptose synthase (sugar kinase/adenylyltransferase)